MSTPAGTSTCTVRLARTRPWPAHVVQGFGMTVPYPRQVPHGLEVMTLPSNERTARWIWPVPRQMSQVMGEVPGAQHEPSQVSQRIAVSTSMSRLVPKTTSSRSTSMRSRASCPRSRRDRGPVGATLRRPEERLEDVAESEAARPPPAPNPACGPRS